MGSCSSALVRGTEQWVVVMRGFLGQAPVSSIHEQCSGGRAGGGASLPVRLCPESAGEMLQPRVGPVGRLGYIPATCGLSAHHGCSYLREFWGRVVPSSWPLERVEPRKGAWLGNGEKGGEEGMTGPRATLQG